MASTSEEGSAKMDDYLVRRTPLEYYPTGMKALELLLAWCNRTGPLDGCEWKHLFDVTASVRPLNIQVALLNRVVQWLLTNHKLVQYSLPVWVLRENLTEYLPMLTSRSNLRKNSGWRRNTRDEW